MQEQLSKIYRLKNFSKNINKARFLNERLFFCVRKHHRNSGSAPWIAHRGALSQVPNLLSCWCLPTGISLNTEFCHCYARFTPHKKQNRLLNPILTPKHLEQVAHKEVWPVREKLRSLLTWPGGKTCHFSKLIQELLSAVVWQLILSRLSTRSPTPTPRSTARDPTK